jgi:hypothetical protein
MLAWFGSLHLVSESKANYQYVRSALRYESPFIADPVFHLRKKRSGLNNILPTETSLIMTSGVMILWTAQIQSRHRNNTYIFISYRFLLLSVLKFSSFFSSVVFSILSFTSWFQTHVIMDKSLSAEWRFLLTLENWKQHKKYICFIVSFSSFNSILSFLVLSVFSFFPPLLPSSLSPFS